MGFWDSHADVDGICMDFGNSHADVDGICMGFWNSMRMLTGSAWILGIPMRMLTGSAWILGIPMRMLMGLGKEASVWRRIEASVCENQGCHRCFWRLSRVEVALNTIWRMLVP